MALVPLTTLRFANPEAGFQRKTRFRMIRDFGHDSADGTSHLSGLAYHAWFWKFFSPFTLR